MFLLRYFFFFYTFDFMIRLRKIFLLLLLLFCAQAKAQFYDLGQDPASVRWKMIKTEHFKIIFPAEIETQAQHVSNMMEQAYAPLCASLKSKPVKICVILHNRAIISNAEVPWAPKRIEFYTCPSQDDYPQPWLDQLVVHEFRHLAQYSKINSGFTKVLSYLFGQQITAGVMGTFVPMWFIEGDAVCTETAFSHSGRGRVPAFEMELRAQVVDKGIYRYNKAVFGSFTTYIPDRYILGYHLVASAEKHFGTQVWEQAMNRSAKLPFMVVPFNSGIHKVSKLNKVGLYKYCLTELDSAWKQQDAEVKKTPTTVLSVQPHKLYTSYNNGSFLDHNAYLAAKSGINDITRFVKIDSLGKEHRILTPGDYFPTSICASGNKVLWSEGTVDPRWDNRTYAVIKSYDVLTHTYKQLTYRTRYFAPSVNNKGDKIACVEQSVDGKSYIAVLNAATGSLLYRVAADTGDFLMFPDWADNDKEIVMVALNKDGKRICLIDSTNHIQSLTQASFTEMNQPHKFGNHVYYIGAYSGIDNLYVIDMTTRKTYQATSSRYGLTDPALSPDGKEVLYSDYSADGYQLVKHVIDSSQWIPLPDVVNSSVKLYESVAQHESGVLDFYKTGQTTYPTKKYSKLLHLFNFHSWGPISVDADNTTIKPGFEIMSQNVLSTMVASAGYEHDWLLPTQGFYAKVSYRGWYPQIDLEVNYQLNKKDNVHWDVFSAQAIVKVPLKLNKGKYYIFVQPQVAFAFYDLIPRKNYSMESYSGYFQAMEYRLYAYHLLKTSERDINPRWGQLVDVNFRHTPFSGNNLGNMVSVETMFYFPGIGRHHSLNAYVAWQRNDATHYMFSDIVSFPQAIDMSGYHQLMVGKLAYEMPLFYPDWSIGSLLYIKRFRAGLYYDQALAQDWHNGLSTYNSVGASLLMDFHALRFLAPLSLGVRTTYRFYDGAIVSELLYSVNFNQLGFKPAFSRFKN